jgi:hypothetical protein
MKIMSLLMVLSFLTLVACQINSANYHVPAGYVRCQKNEDCRGPGHFGEFCGFVGVDTYPVCRR